MAESEARSRWLAQITVDTPACRNRSVGVAWYMVGTITTGTRPAKRSQNSNTSRAWAFLLWISTASAPASA